MVHVMIGVTVNAASLLDFKMTKTLIVFFITAFSAISSQNIIASEANSHAHDHDDDEHSEGTTNIHAEIATQVGIETSIAGPRTLHQTMTAFGLLTTGPEQTSHVRARFSGVVKSVSVSIGDSVKKDDLLAVIESNESFKKYEVRAPIAGVITQRHANTGEMTQEQVLFSVVNFETLWAEFRIFPSQLQSVKAGQAVYIVVGDRRLSSKIEHLLPAEGHPYVLARAKISDSQKGLYPGAMVEGQIVSGVFDVKLAVQNSGLQIMEGSTGVFIKHDHEYTFMPLVLGRSDGEFTEVISGLGISEFGISGLSVLELGNDINAEADTHIENKAEYVTKNSYLIKADIEKSEAEHEH